jgi:RHH-type proline utilization regulon transcriptional repressor/proline dehydrogenase/delta 1-pyrroline-5-carboxylate dehydrogenase
LPASAESYAWAWQTHFSQAHDPSNVLGERNLFRYCPCRRIIVRAEPATAADGLALLQAVLAARACGVDLQSNMTEAEGWSRLAGENGVQHVAEPADHLAQRLRAEATAERLRLLTPGSLDLYRAANEAHLAVIDAPPLANGRLELHWYLREQAISQTVHRYGNLLFSGD